MSDHSWNVNILDIAVVCLLCRIIFDGKVLAKLSMSSDVLVLVAAS